MRKNTAAVAAGLASLALFACGGDEGGGATNKPTSAELQNVIKQAGFGLSCEVELENGPPIEGVVEHKLMKCPDPVATDVTVGSYYRYKDDDALAKGKSGWDGSPHFENGNVAIVVANLNGAPKELPARMKKACGCGQLGGGAPES